MADRVVLPSSPTEADYAKWLTSEVERRMAKALQRGVYRGDLKWSPDPQHEGVFGLLVAGTNRAVLIAYDFGEDFETSQEADDLVAKRK